jgi:uncharacterized membrane protein
MIRVRHGLIVLAVIHARVICVRHSVIMLGVIVVVITIMSMNCFRFFGEMFHNARLSPCC